MDGATPASKSTAFKCCLRSLSILKKGKAGIGRGQQQQNRTVWEALLCDRVKIHGCGNTESSHNNKNTESFSSRIGKKIPKEHPQCRTAVAMGKEVSEFLLSQ